MEQMNSLQNWVLSEDSFNVEHSGKFESIFCQGNGYMGVRAAHEEIYAQTVRDTFVAGTFNQFGDEVTELPNVPDVIELAVFVNGQRMNLLNGSFSDYKRTLNMRNGLLERTFVWCSKDGVKVQFCFRRIVSMDNIHVIAQKVIIKPITHDVEITIVSGIDGRMSNSGDQHFREGEKSIAEKAYIQAVYSTTQSEIDFCINTTHKFILNGEEVEPVKLPKMDRRIIQYEMKQNVNRNDTLVVEKISNIYTSRDKEFVADDLQTIKDVSRKDLKQSAESGFDGLFLKSAESWQEKVWNVKDIIVDSENDMDQLAIRFAIYHLTVMSPVHDNRMNIGAKGMSGEGYKGHTFWDTEVFMLPYFIYTDKKSARSLLEYRYLGLEGARRKAKESGYEGAMYPWESAWIEDGEVTPKVGGADIITGLPLPILTGDLEIHITCDVIFGVYQYYQCTKDQDFMNRFGYEMIMDAARFWASRLEWYEERNRYEIADVIGPDEYKEHANNNAYTNYMAHWTICYAMESYTYLKENRKDIFEKLDEKLNLSQAYETWSNVQSKIYLPQPNDNLIIPQDDNYLSLPEIDLKKYKESEKIGSIYDDYNMEQINRIQVSKQADVVLLLHQLAFEFPQEVRAANFYYYEQRCLHDSSLSLAIHSIFANELGERDLAYELFKRACLIDLGPNMKSSDMGVHAASLGGIWQSVVFGFGGVRVRDGKLYINPCLPKAWNRVAFEIEYADVRIAILATEEALTVRRLKGTDELEFICKEQEYHLTDKIEISL